MAVVRDRVTELLQEAIKTRENRSAVYGQAGHETFGAVMDVFFPEGLSLDTPDDHARYALVVMLVGKLCRYMNNYNEGGHKDSLKDIQVYAAMLEAHDES